MAPCLRRKQNNAQSPAVVLSRCTYDITRAGACPVLLGGDHSLSIGSVNGIARHAHEIGRELFVLWLDAHADLNTPATTPPATCMACPRPSWPVSLGWRRCLGMRLGRLFSPATYTCSGSALWTGVRGNCCAR